MKNMTKIWGEPQLQRQTIFLLADTDFFQSLSDIFKVEAVLS